MDATLSVRPEAWRFVTGGDSVENTVSGRVVATAYLGALVQYEVEVKGGIRLRVAEMNPQAVREGEVMLQVRAEDVVSLEK